MGVGLPISLTGRLAIGTWIVTIDPNPSISLDSMETGSRCVTWQELHALETLARWCSYLCSLPQTSGCPSAILQIVTQLSVERIQATAEAPYYRHAILHQGFFCQSYSTLSHSQTRPCLLQQLPDFSLALSFLCRRYCPKRVTGRF